MQKAIKKFIKTTIRLRSKKNNVVKYEDNRNNNNHSNLLESNFNQNEPKYNNLQSYFTKGSNQQTLPDYDENAPKRVSSEVFDSGVKYVGELIEKNKNGFGVQYWRDGATYNGEWKNHKADGLGAFKHSDGDQ